ncbi:uncharacterized protein LOC126750512 isoform X2 [Anthonomus grandis grandis]|uniref:uncharacterized protein LOC126736436 isoform X2 n=1 Tax=Anthonomus grandis grandis TaxID=2921223 RepID=UPI0021669222|nr:uncharacterized protein LOC126736436 isoform X2 [Anthonomus grandis grandis]XP_050297887.1 uncharacterized protein LOC126737167 isoform X2 [Anthonomus grandis grandis]XP_050299131.1 uncharacterized protein LOC126738009 isoform X2 [Anthonomus grandis grandis]XP_050299382.1 uncharacterized protein LOC126738209 isoform X2 [Anthonomus grandis grandis]XP_050300107.1 uncharacterized protein LOC126738710 isoform X2 [Anthonomus grandis grandis]XP_050306894.1 uncharacterized protein LOC126743723 iso
MDVDKLISLVLENKSLWDMKDKSYHNRDQSRQKWEKIAQEMNTSQTVKNKWRGLRDTYRKEFKKCTETRSGQEGGRGKESTWPYYTAMLFLKDQFAPRIMQSSIPEPEADGELENDVGEFDDSSEDDLDDESQLSAIASSNSKTEKNFRSQSQRVAPDNPDITPQTKRAKIAKSSAFSKLLEIEQKKLEEFKKKNAPVTKKVDQEDADYHFLMSLLPYLKNVPEERKMIVRNKLQQVFCDEQYFQQQKSCGNTYPSSHYSYYNKSSEPMHNTRPTSSCSLLTTPSGPSSVETAEHDNINTYTDLATFFSSHNPGP